MSSVQVIVSTVPGDKVLDEPPKMDVLGDVVHSEVVHRNVSNPLEVSGNRRI